MRGKQRSRCLACGYHDTGGAGGAYPDEPRQLALQRYLEGMGLRASGRGLGVSNGPVMRWGSAYGQRAEQQAAAAAAPQPVRLAEGDEWHRYGGQKKTPAGSGSR
jgi:transposase-like protein